MIFALPLNFYFSGVRQAAIEIVIDVKKCVAVLLIFAYNPIYTTNPTEHSTAAIERSTNESGLK